MADYVGLETTGHVLLEGGGGILLETSSAVSITSWLWDFGDGTTSTLQNPTHVYAAGGTYTVSLTVTTSDGGSDTETKVAYVVVVAVLSVVVGGVPSAQQFGLLAPSVGYPQTVQVPGLPQRTGLFGQPILVPGKVTVTVGGIPSAQRFGTVWIVYWQPLPVLGVQTAARLGKPRVAIVWWRDSTCTDLDLATSSCTDLVLSASASTTLTLAGVTTTTLDLAASTAEDLDLQPVGSA